MALFITNFVIYMAHIDGSSISKALSNNITATQDTKLYLNSVW